MLDHKVDGSQDRKLTYEEEQGAVYVAVDGRLIGCIHVHHGIRSDVSPNSLERLRKLGILHIGNQNPCRASAL